VGLHRTWRGSRGGRPLPGDVTEAVLAFHARQRESGPAIPPAAGYQVESLTALGLDDSDEANGRHQVLFVLSTGTLGCLQYLFPFAEFYAGSRLVSVSDS
jgi:hypothetical protein